jgi:hypothetical protein
MLPQQWSKKELDVRFPGLLLARIDPAQAAEKPLDGSEKSRQRLAVALEYAKHVAAERLGYRENDRRKEQNLNPSIDCHNFS